MAQSQAAAMEKLNDYMGIGGQTSKVTHVWQVSKGLRSPNVARCYDIAERASKQARI